MVNPLLKIISLTAICGFIGSGLMMFGRSNLSEQSSKLSQQEPQAIFVLGGAPSREKFAAKFALQHPKLPIFVSSGSPEEYAEYVFDQAGVSRDRLHLDYRAVDTVSNFTVMVREFENRNIKNIYLLTSDSHMPRAEVIAKIVLGSRGIQIYPVKIPSEFPSEPPVKSLRDGVRAMIWLVTDTK
ncbi:MAG: YdcF family protein [Pseudanabaenaceae cyanobacterium bins.39]|nr:YdcF family protein [Pseudanabaenaceae cyanobacterium bins.39]